ncbi:glutamate-1-semialdehyde 2,1-aminomutase [Clostridium guangxiense]|uniref:glutamate-1-semialdehyde 2,1-aminomutase n=1 Tax=Clostridium guangxiense TaxID=1662055 RepID=UPI001E461200|nr:glutamate-1-semialdehyde 2,1-aminomutase [Clostridium guangxiense]MCD2347026.1 glutamate-1-semialdehyde 2,1-aminomutase [Clostridium guangxiense]
MKNKEIFEESKKYMPGGVNSPVRAYTALNIDPPIIKKGYGSHLFDEEGKEYIDFIEAWGPMILGHSNEKILKEIEETLKSGVGFGAPTELELKLAKYICTTVDNVDMLRMVNSGTEATMSAVKLARGYTHRDKIIKFAGCYHGHFDGFLVEAGSGVLTENIPGSPGVPKGSVENTLIAEYNNIESVKTLFEKHKDEIAAVIIEPVAGNMGVIPGKKEFLLDIRKICTENRTILIFDEVMSGFRVAYKGAQSLYNIKPDLVTFAKIMGGGLPCGAYGGKREIMEQLSPMGPVYQAGTMSGNPIVMAAGYASLKELNNNPDYYSYMDKMGEKLQAGIYEIARQKGISLVVNRCVNMMTVFFTECSEVTSYEEAKKSNTKMFSRFAEHMIKNGVYVPPSQFEAMFIGVKHTEEDIEKFLEVMKEM